MNKARKSGQVVSLVVSLVVMLLLGNTTAWGAPTAPRFVTDELIVELKAGAPDGDFRKALVGQGAEEAGEIPQLRFRKIKVPAKSIEKVKAALAKHSHVKSVGLNYVAEGLATPNDPSFVSQWHLPKIAAPLGWDISTGSNVVDIAIVDSGVDPAHPDLAGKLLPGYNFLSLNSDTHDVYGHGTKVAGSAAAIANNGVGVSGVAWQNPVMPLVVLNSSNFASYYDIAQAVIYAADHGVKVINISIGGTSSDAYMQSAMNYAWSKGAVIVAAAGNSGNTTPMYPAACTNVVAVAATTSTDTRASFSNYGSWITLAAPGSSIYTTTNGGGYGSVSGTSFASPITAGLAALVFSVNPTLTNQQVVDILKQNADDLGTAGFDTTFGFGRINVQKSLQAAKNALPQPDTTPPTAAITSLATGQTVSGSVTVGASASDNKGVVKVDLYVNGSLLATDSSTPYSFFWDTTAVADGSYQLEARSSDAAGNIGSSSVVTVTVSNPKDTTAPSVALTSPANGQTVAGSVTVGATASDASGIAKVDFYVNGVLTASDSTYPYSYLWDTSKLADGTYTLQARVMDGAGLVGSSTVATVNVANPKDTVAPTVSVTAPANGSVVTALRKVTVTAKASDNVAVVRSDLYIDGALKSSVASGTLSWTWNLRGIAAGAHQILVKSFDAAGNVGQATITVTK